MNISCPNETLCPELFELSYLETELSNCEELVEICLNFSILEAGNYSFTHNGQQYTGNGGFCKNSTNTAIYVGYGNHELIVSNIETGCTDTLLVKASCTMDAKHISETIKETEVGEYCLSTSEKEGLLSTACYLPTNSTAQFYLDTLRHCISFEGIQEGSETVCFLLCEQGLCDTTYLTINVLPFTDNEVEADDDFSQTNQGEEVEIDITANDRASNSITQIEIIEQPMKGQVLVNDDNTLTYIPTEEACRGVRTDQFTYRICTSNDCANATVSVNVACNPPRVYTGFSPNGDGLNDKLIIEGLEIYPDNNLKIFNRWGTLLYEQSNYKNNWEGTYKNNPLPDGIYFYVLDDGLGNKFSGFIHIRK